MDLVNFHVHSVVVVLLLAAAVAGSWLDIYYSKRFVTYGGTEANPINRDEYGFFAAKWNIALTAAILAAILVLCFTVSTQWSFAFIPIAVIRGIVAVFRNKKTTDYSRTQQIAWLRGLRDAATDTASTPSAERYLQGRYTIAAGRIWRDNFPQVYSTDLSTITVPGVLIDGQPATAIAGMLEVNRKLIELSRRPEPEWFV